MIERERERSDEYLVVTKNRRAFPFSNETLLQEEISKTKICFRHAGGSRPKQEAQIYPGLRRTWMVWIKTNK